MSSNAEKLYKLIANDSKKKKRIVNSDLQDNENSLASC